MIRIDDVDCYLGLLKYPTGNIALVAYEENGDIYCPLSRNIAGYVYRKDEITLDENNIPEVIEIVSKYNLGKLSGIRVASGYCTYPSCRINPQEVKKHNNVK